MNGEPSSSSYGDDEEVDEDRITSDQDDLDFEILSNHKFMVVVILPDSPTNSIYFEVCHTGGRMGERGISDGFIVWMTFGLITFLIIFCILAICLSVFTVLWCIQGCKFLAAVRVENKSRQRVNTLREEIRLLKEQNAPPAIDAAPASNLPDIRQQRVGGDAANNFDKTKGDEGAVEVSINDTSESD